MGRTTRSPKGGHNKNFAHFGKRQNHISGVRRDTTQGNDWALPDGTPLEFQDPASTLVADAVYNPQQQVAIVTLRSGWKGAFHLPTSGMWTAFYNAHSRGAYFNTVLRPLGGIEMRGDRG